MSNRKINYNRPVPSSDSIKKRQNFDDVLNQVVAVPTPFFKSLGFWGAIGSSVIAITLLTNQYFNSVKENNAYEANPTLSIQSNELPQDTKCITPINDQVDHEFETFVIQPDKSSTIYVEGGAIITIPASAFLTESSEDIVIKARVFRDKSEAYVAGVPMDYGMNEAFESAGMIEIRGSQNGKEVELNADQEIEVTLGLHKSPDDFGFYALEDQTGEWSVYSAEMKSISHEKPATNDLVQVIQSELNKGIERLESIEKEISTLTSPEKAEYHIAENKQQVFELKFNKHEFPELRSFEQLQFEAKCSALKYSEVLVKTWTDVDLQQGENGEYQAKFSNRKGAKITVDVVPVVSGKQAEEAFRKYSSEKKRIEKERLLKQEELESIRAQNSSRQQRISNLQSQSEQRDQEYLDGRSEAAKEEFTEKVTMLNEFYNASATFRTNRWGVFNCDKPVKYPNAPLSPYSFASNNNPVKAREIHVFDLDKDVQYRYGTQNHPLASAAVNNSETVIIVQDRNGNMGYARVHSRQDIQNGKIKLIPINAKDADMEFFKALLDEDTERVRA